MAIQQNFPAIVPSLSLDFAAVQALDPRITFSRASTATYYGTETAKAEENLLLYSQEFNDSYWQKARISVTANDTTAPDGTTTAERLTQASGQTTAGVVFNLALPAIGGLAYTYSVFAKAGTGRNFVVLEDTFLAASQNTWFDLSTGTVGTVNPSHTASIVNVGNGWYRCIITVTAFSTATRGVLFRVAETDNSLVVTDDQGFIFLWGAQLEQRSAVTAYTPTTTQPITNYIPVLESAASGVARFDHNPITFESLGLLIEEQRTNLVLRSEEFDNASWQKVRCSAQSNVIIAPNGTLTGDKIVESTDGSTHALLSANLTISSSTHTGSCYLKAGERTYALLGIGTTTSGVAYFDLEDGVVGTVTGGYTATITPVGNDWYRCSVTGTIAANGAGALTIYTALDNNVAGYTGDGFSGIFIWGAQLEAGSFPTSFIPTVASQVTRAADAASMTGANFSSWYNAGAGTLYSEATAIASSSFPSFTPAEISNGNFDRRMLHGITGSVYRTYFQFPITSLNTSTTATAGVFAKLATGYDTTGVSMFASGGTVVAGPVWMDSAATNMLRIGASFGGAGNNYVRKIAYYPVRLSDTNLQALTS